MDFKTKIKLSDGAEHIINILWQSGFEAYAVGGAVRDSILGIPAYDYDITTNASPDAVKSIFDKTIDTGIKHGTVTVVADGETVEVTTYRKDGEYKDHRKPDSVDFVPDLKTDLERRDFTINAIAYSPNEGIKDPFCGIEDINAKIIRAVGDSEKRFKEDALRMMRAVRFSCQLGFTIEQNTLNQITENRPLLQSISAERIKTELEKALISDNIYNMKYFVTTGLLDDIMPEFKKMFSVEQNCTHHIYNVGDHTLYAISHIENNPLLRWTMLLHDFGKVYMKTTDKNGKDHFKGHDKKSTEIALSLMRKLKFSNHEKHIISTLISLHDLRIKADKHSVKLLLNQIGDDMFDLLLKVQRADCMAQTPALLDSKLKNLESIEDIYAKIIKYKEPYLLKHLAINGTDLLNAGIKAKDIGACLNDCLIHVIKYPDKNSRGYLLKYLSRSGDK